MTIRVSDGATSARFYDLVLGTLGIEGTGHPELPEWEDFGFAEARSEDELTRGLHVGFAAPSRAHVDEFWRAGVGAGYSDDGEPGPRPQYRDDYYGAFLLDPDGNSVEACHHGLLRDDGVIDHVWVRVADLAAAERFYGLAAEHIGAVRRWRRDDPPRVAFGGPTGSLSLVAGEPTRNVHLAFPASENGAVDRFHAALTAAGYRDNGPPGERPIYHPGYYGAFVLDPDGNNIEVVNHNRG